MWCLSATLSPTAGRAQSLRVPLGAAGAFGLLSGDTLQAARSGSLAVEGRAGAADTVTGLIRATQGVYRPLSAAPMAAALADLATARQYASALPATPLGTQLAGATLAPGAYRVTGNATLAAGTSLTLTGDTSAWYVLTVTGDLWLAPGAQVHLGQVPAAHVVWNVTGATTLDDNALAAGTFLGGGRITKRGLHVGAAALLSEAGVVVQIPDPLMGSSTFWAPDAARVPVPPACVDITNQRRWPANLVRNPDFEWNRACPIGQGNMDSGSTRKSDVCLWYSPNPAGTSDYFRHCAGTYNDPLAPMQFTANSLCTSAGGPLQIDPILGSRLPGGGPNESFVGLYAFSSVRWSSPTNLPPYREYVQTKLVEPVVAGGIYFGEFSWRLADFSGRAVSTLAMVVSGPTDLPAPNAAVPAPVLTQNGQTMLGRAGVYCHTNTLATALTEKGTWSQLGGFFTNQSADQYLTIGNFEETVEDTTSALQNTFNVASPDGDCMRAYYLIDNVVLCRLPDPQPVACAPANQPLVLGLPPYPLPAGFSARYHWERLSGTGVLVDSTAAQTQVVGAAQFDAFQLTVKLRGKVYVYPPTGVRVQPAASLTLSQANVCAGSTVALTLTTGLPNYQLLAISPQTGITTNLTPAGSPLTATLYVQPTATTRYALVLPPGTNPLVACPADTVFVTVTVNTAGATATLQAGPDTVCAGTPVTLTYAVGNATLFRLLAIDAGGTQYLASGAAPTGSATYYHAPTRPTTYRLVATDGNGCERSATQAVTVNPAPLVTISSSAATGNTVCGGQPVTLRASGAAAYRWNTGLTTADLVVQTPLAGGTFTYTVTGTNAAGCAATASFTLTVQPPPVVGIVALNAVVCAGAAVQLFATGDPSYVYSWNTGAQGSAVVVQIPGQGPSVTYTVVATNPATTCSAAATLTLQIEQPTATAGGPYGFFTNQTQPLQGQGTPAGGSGTWQELSGTLQIANNQVQNPQPGTYLVCYTYTTPAGCVAADTTTLTLVAPDCPESQSGYRLVVDLGNPGAVGGTTQGDTVEIDGSGRVYTFLPSPYLVTANLKLVNGDFVLPPGCELLMRANTRLTVGRKARLLVQGARLTAACTDLWDGLYLAGPQAELYFGTRDAYFGDRLPEPDSPKAPQTAGELSHSRQGLVWRQPNENVCRVWATRFFCNRYASVQLSGPTGAGAPVTTESGLVNNDFEADPLAFKNDPRDPACCVGNATYTYAHLSVDGWDCRQLVVAGNRVAHGLLGYYAAPKQVQGAYLATIDQNFFEENLLAAVYVAEVNQGPLTLTGNIFHFAPPALRPSVAVLRAFATAWPAARPPNQGADALGLYVGRTDAPGELNLVGNTFVQPAYARPHALPDPTPQIGAEVLLLNSPYTLRDNTFEYLTTGLRLGLFYPGDALSEVGGNTFNSCTAGLSLWNTGLPRAAICWPRCNSFLRDTRTPGYTCGLVVEPGTQVVLDQFGAAPLTTPMKNYFGGQAPFHSFNRWIDNQSGTTLIYATYQRNALLIPVNLNVSGDFTPTNAPGISARTSVPVRLEQAQDLCQGADNYPDTGVNPARSGGTNPLAVATLSSTDQPQQLSALPNPASNEVTINYKMSPKTGDAMLLVRDALGRIIRQLPLSHSVGQILLEVSGLPAGIYRCALVQANGAQAKCTLLVQH